MGSGPPGPPGSGLPRPRSLCERTPHVHVAPLFSKVLLCWAPPGILHHLVSQRGNRGGDKGMCDRWSGCWGARLLPVCSALHTALPGPITEQPAVAQCSVVPTRTCKLLRDGGHSTAVRPRPAGLNAAQTAGAGLALIGFLLGTASLSTGKESDRILIPGAPPGTLRGPPSLTGEILLRSPSRVGERDPRQFLAGHRLSWSFELSHWAGAHPGGSRAQSPLSWPPGPSTPGKEQTGPGVEKESR